MRVPQRPGRAGSARAPFEARRVAVSCAPRCSVCDRAAKEARHRAAVTRTAIGSAGEAAAKLPGGRGVVAAGPWWPLRGSWHDLIPGSWSSGAASRRRTSARRRVLGAALGEKTAAELRGLAVELIVGRCAFWSHATDYGAALKRACELLRRQPHRDLEGDGAVGRGCGGGQTLTQGEEPAPYPRGGRTLWTSAGLTARALSRWTRLCGERSSRSGLGSMP